MSHPPLRVHYPRIPGAFLAGLDVKQFGRIDLGGFGDSIADSSVVITPAQRISSP